MRSRMIGVVSLLAIGALSVAVWFPLSGCAVGEIDKQDQVAAAAERRLAVEADALQAAADSLKAQADALPPDAPGKPEAVKKAGDAQAAATQKKAAHDYIAGERKELGKLREQANAPPPAPDPAVTAGGTAIGGPVGGFVAGALAASVPWFVRNRQLLAAALSIGQSIQQVINAHPPVAAAFEVAGPTISKVQTPLARKIVDQAQELMAKNGQMPVA